MKTLIALISCALFTINVQAQRPTNKLTDDLLPQKNTVISKYLPINIKTGYRYSLYAMEVPEVQAKLEAFNKEMMTQVEQQKTSELQTLAKKDLYYYETEVMKTFVTKYGLDSVGEKNLEKVVIEKKNDPNLLALMLQAYSKAFTKKLDPVEKKRLLGKIYENPEVSNEVLFKRSASYRTWVTDYVTYLKDTKYKSDTSLRRKDKSIAMLKVVKNEIPDGFVKDYLICQNTLGVLKAAKNEPPVKEEVYKNFMASTTNADYKKEVQSVYENIKRMNGNGPSPLFTYATPEGKKISLKDLRGKYVYIDVWATWCAPCKGEIPSLQKIEQDYEGKNIHFVSLSADKMADKGKWMSYVKDNKLGGIQLMSDNDFNSEFIKQYNINSIPRFILIDPAGNIVSADAKRPSDPALRTQLDQLLNK